MFARRFLFLYRADLSAPRKNSANSNYSRTYEIPGVGDIPVSLSDQFAPLLTRLFPLHAIALPATPLFPLHTQKRGVYPRKNVGAPTFAPPFLPTLHRSLATGRCPFSLGHTNVTTAGGRNVLQRCSSLRGAAASIAASNCWAWSNGREMRKRSARRA